MEVGTGRGEGVAVRGRGYRNGREEEGGGGRESEKGWRRENLYVVPLGVIIIVMHCYILCCIVCYGQVG